MTATPFIALSETFATLAIRLGQVTPPEKPEEASGDARQLLRWLKNLQALDQDMYAWLEAGNETAVESKAETLAQLVGVYAASYTQALGQNASIANDETILDASEAVSAIALAVIEHTLDKLPEGDPNIERLEALIPSLPRRAGLRQAQAVQRLLAILEAALARTSGMARERTPQARLTEMQGRLDLNAKKLRSIDTLEPPVREESIELAREILRRLKNMQFSDRTLESLVTAGRPEDKAALAEKIEEMVDTYRNLLMEAAQITPAILQDKQVKDANDTVSSFAHAVALMASREMPSSIADTQQISAEASRAPEQWKHLSGQTIDRLMKTMEAAVEKAVHCIEQQQQQQEQRAHDMAQEAAEQAAKQEQQQGRGSRRRRHRGGSSGGLTKSAKRRTANDLNGDGIADAVQGLRIRPEDLIAVRQLGNSLRDASQQATKDSKNKLKDTKVGKDEKILPDDKGFSARKKDERDRDKINPKNQGPRV